MKPAPRRRTIFYVIALLAAGAALNVAVAWGLAVWVNLGHEPVRLSGRGEWDGLNVFAFCNDGLGSQARAIGVASMGAMQSPPATAGQKWFVDALIAITSFRITPHLLDAQEPWVEPFQALKDDLASTLTPSARKAASSSNLAFLHYELHETRGWPMFSMEGALKPVP